MLTSPASAWSKSVGCRFGCFGGLGSSTCLEVPGIRLDMLSVRFRLRNSFESRLSFRLSLNFLASSSAFFDCCFHFAISSSLDVPVSCFRYSVISFLIFSNVSCSFHTLSKHLPQLRTACTYKECIDIACSEHFFLR